MSETAYTISCAKTTQAVVERTKTVTRRWGWRHARVGMRLRIVDRLRYRGSDPPQRILAYARIVQVDLVNPFDHMDQAELEREGCGHMTESEFLSLILSMKPRGPSAVLRRIEWMYEPSGEFVSSEDWNKSHPVGMPVRYFPVLPPTPSFPPRETTTRSEAWDLHGRPMVMVTGQSGAVHLAHVEPLTIAWPP